jgi:cathepsin X
VYEWIYEDGVADVTCEQYMAEDPSAEDVCTALNKCRDCSPPPPKEGESGLDKCYSVDNFKRYYVKEYASVSEIDHIKAEIAERGPIACGIYSTDKFHTYKGGIFEESGHDDTPLNHFISLVGYGKDGDTEYWIGRNSWGTYWGEQGFFKVKMGKDNLGVEKACGWATPSFSKVSEDKKVELIA